MRTKRKLGLLIAIMFVLMMVLSSVAFAGNQENNVNVLIMFDHQPGKSDEALVRAFGGTIKNNFDLIPTIAASVPVAALKGLQNNPHVLIIEEDVEVYVTSETYDWGVDAVEADLIHSMTNYDGSGVKVAVVDTGIDFSHVDLPNEVQGYNAIKPWADPIDDNGHGTHVAGTIAATIDNELGLIGIAPNVELYAVKVLNRRGSGYISDIIEGIEWCANNGIQVANNSYGSSSDPGQNYELAYINATEAGVLLIGSAGNEGLNDDDPLASTVGYPAAYDSVMAVAAVDSDYARASFSSVGEAVEIAAPGVNILSTYPGDRLATMSGTSMAAPHVTGVAALLIQQETYTTPEAVRNRLTATAEDLGSEGRDNWYGYGFVRADLALGVSDTTSTNTPPTITLNSEGSTFEVGESIQFSATANDDEDGDLTGSINWYVGEELQSVSGGSFSIIFGSVGDYTVRSEVTDAEGATAVDSLVVSIVEAPVETGNHTLKVKDIKTYWSDINPKKPNTIFNVEVLITDQDDNAASGAAVTIDISFNGVYKTGTAVTDNEGIATFLFRNIPYDQYGYVVEVTNVSLDGYDWP